MGHSQGYTQRGYMFIHCESRGTWACVSVYWSSALKSWLCLWKIVSMKERSCTYQIPTEFKCSFMTWRKTYLFVCFIVEMEAAWYGFVQLCLQGGGFRLILCSLWFLWALWTQSHARISHRFQIASSSFCLSFCPSLGYQISYRLDSRDPLRWTTVEVGSNARQFTVTGLSSEQSYVFRLIARTAVGWGAGQEAVVVTTERRGKGHSRIFRIWLL